MTKHARRDAPASTDAFTDVTWKSLGLLYGRDLRSGRTASWMVQHDLSVELWRAVEHWDFETAASAVEAAGSHLPVLITWTAPGNNKQREVHTGYVIIEHVSMSPCADPRLRLRYSGFSHSVYASQVRVIEQVGVTLTFEAAPWAKENAR
jgi:hypothetical protein